MSPWLESLAVFALGAGGAAVGWMFSRLKSRWWIAGFFFPLVIVLAIGATRWFRALDFVPPFSLLVAGRREFALMAIVITMLLTTPLMRLGFRRQRILVAIFMVVFLVHSAVMPFLSPALVRSRLLAIQTEINRDGVCIQQTDFTCGPAAAVTALRRLNLPAEEGDLAILMHTCPAAGTPPDTLADALRERYAADGLITEYRCFGSVDELPRDHPTLAVIKFAFLIDHYVTILQIDDAHVTVADPLDGRKIYTRDEFARIWRCTAVTLARPIHQP